MKNLIFIILIFIISCGTTVKECPSRETNTVVGINKYKNNDRVEVRNYSKSPGRDYYVSCNSYYVVKRNQYKIGDTVRFR